MKKYFVSNDTTLPLGGAMVPTKKKKKKEKEKKSTNVYRNFNWAPQ